MWCRWIAVTGLHFRLWLRAGRPAYPGALETAIGIIIGIALSEALLFGVPRPWQSARPLLLTLVVARPSPSNALGRCRVQAILVMLLPASAGVDPFVRSNTTASSGSRRAARHRARTTGSAPASCDGTFDNALRVAHRRARLLAVALDKAGLSRPQITPSNACAPPSRSSIIGGIRRLGGSDRTDLVIQRSGGASDLVPRHA
jgi:hypothetical protein